MDSKKEQTTLIQISANLNELNHIDNLIIKKNIVEGEIQITDRNINSKENAIDLNQSHCNDNRREIKQIGQ